MASLSVMILFYSFTKNFSIDNSWSAIKKEEFEKIVNDSKLFFKSKNYSFQYQLATFKTHDAKTAFETQQGKYIAIGEKYISEILSIKTIQTENYRFSIDTLEQTLLVAQKSNDKGNPYENDIYYIYKELVTKFEKQQTGDNIKLRISFKQGLKIETVEYLFNKDKMLTKVITYYRMKLKEDPESKLEGTSPRTEMTLMNYKKDFDWKDKNIFNDENYIKKEKGKLSPNNKFAKYKLIDTRINKD